MVRTKAKNNRFFFHMGISRSPPVRNIAKVRIDSRKTWEWNEREPQG